MEHTKPKSLPDISTEDLMLINKIHVPPLNDPINIRIYWFQAHSYSDDPSSLYFKSHKHTFHETHFILKGSMTYEVDGKKIVAHLGQFVLIPANIAHTQVCCSDDLVKLSLSFEIIVQPDNPQSQIMNKSLSLSPFLCDSCTYEMLESIKLICAQSKRKMPFAPFTVRNEIFTLITEIYYAVSQNQKRLLIRSDDDATDSRYISAKKFIEDNIYSKLKTEDVAAHVHLSTKQLNRIFLKYGDTSAFDYISEKKHLAAKELLLNTDLSLQEVSEKLGFADEFYFNRYFTQKTGITPRKFRKINGNLIKNKKKGDDKNEVLQ